MTDTPYVVIFDLDGTLVDTPTAIVETFMATFASMEIPVQGPAAIRATIGMPLENAFASLMRIPLSDDRVIICVQRYQRFFKEIVLPKAQALIYPGVTDGLAALQSQGFLLAIATSKFYASADALLRAAELRDRFDLVMGADQVTRPKPDPEMGNLIMRRLDTTAARVVMVGDTTHDLLMAKAAGIRSIAVTYGVQSVQELRSSDPTWIADSFDDAVHHIQLAFQTVEDTDNHARTFN